MSLSAQDCFSRAVTRSSLNEASLFGITNALSHMSVYEQRAFLMAANVNPDFESKQGLTVVRTSVTAPFDLAASPGGIGLINYIEVAAISGTPGPVIGDEVFVVDIRHPELALAPRVTIQGKKVNAVGTDLGPDNPNTVTQLRIHYSFIPAGLTASTDVISLRDEWSHLIITPMAAILAMSDQRVEEYKLLMAEYERDMALYLQHAGSYRYSSIQALGQAPASSPNVPQFGGS